MYVKAMLSSEHLSFNKKLAESAKPAQRIQ